MARKTVGYVNLQWTCPSCGARNEGVRMTCPACGAAMPQDGAFELPSSPVLDTGEEIAARAAAGPDIHCPFCGARNAGDAERCAQCGGQLADGERRESGRVLGAFEGEPGAEQICSACGRTVPAGATRCPACGAVVDGTPAVERAKAPEPSATPKRRLLPLLAIVIGLLVVCGAGAVFLSRSTGAPVAEVRGLNWAYSVEIEALTPVTRQNWRDAVPENAVLGDCVPRVRHTLPEPAPRATEICGTPYVVDTGTGVGEVVQDCQYQIADDWCQYSVSEWRAARTEVVSGSGETPAWPLVRLGGQEREGPRAERYTVVLTGDGREYTYHPRSLEDYARFQPGSRWRVTTNALGGVTSVEPTD